MEEKLKDMTVVNGIIEVAGEYRGRDWGRLREVVSRLQHGIIQDCRVVFVGQQWDAMTPIQDGMCHIPHFGYDYHCEPHCPHDPEPYGVNRYFGFTIVLHGSFAAYNLGSAYEIGITSYRATFTPVGILHDDT